MNIVFFKVGLEQRIIVYMMAVHQQQEPNYYFRTANEADGICECRDGKWSVSKNRFNIPEESILIQLQECLEFLSNEVRFSRLWG